MTQALEAIDCRDSWAQTDDSSHMNGPARMGDDLRTSVVDTSCRSWDIPNLWICDGSVFPTIGGVNAALPTRSNC
jgi:choline dehydrogenase-like flavoprotein